ncbi:MAG TPA: hypothetical protein PK431_07520 [Chitinophagales bacterium]|nr:hypothetical protein [Chitinophagales bacterium]
MTGLLLFASCNRQTKENKQLDYSTKTQMDNYELTPETAHPKAKKLMTEEFYWSPIEESGPFGSDDGSDAFYGLRQWRQSNKTVSPTVYLKELIEGWGYPPFDWNEMDTTKISQYISAKTQIDNSEIEKNIPTMLEHFKSMGDSSGKQIDEAQLREIMASTSSSMGGSFLLGLDNAIIAVGFGQFVLEGKIDEDIKTLTKTAINRELLPILIDRWDGEYNKTRKEQLTKMLASIDKMNE